ncbi:protein of unknown function [Halobacillus karajensis]|uniref:DUF2935 domain-containing protein n=1 Tax=Halobacillus karajensis TaxID=195088 RepID=A0A024P8D5_9BACI|nr:DUF2935 domain-containing protein [Halobacillus karajensis]CDQ21444.1 hypothetical protein BN982_03830 [Halobacillus karajensis]CDQ25379.1 hypothetical protein BN983_03710 [Halobacillus karajensis]CDQ29703.1 hypothetical protein BN981_04124 [Halobacillus karajensis]SEI07694.1 protein of unknown function [Halobacillus karajensis]
MKDYGQQAKFEHLFWLQILGDHARFIRDSLYPSEEQRVEKAKEYVKQWDDLLKRVRKDEVDEMAEFSRSVGVKARDFHKFKLNLIEASLFGKVKIHLSPTFMNHMVNELEEYLLVLGFLGKGDIPPLFHELHHHMLWLMDASGHAGAINDEMDSVERRLKEKSDTFRQHFNQFYIKAVEMKGYLRTNQHSFPALTRFNNEVELEMKIFRTFLQELEEMELNEVALGTFSTLMADHMAREECYYLYKLAETTQGEFPECDPTKPRIE